MKTLVAGFFAAAVLATAGGVHAGSIEGLPPTLVLRAASGISFQDVPIAGETRFDKESGNYIFQGGVSGRNDFRIDNLILVTNPDPFVSYSFGLVNFTGSPIAFSFTFTTPVVGSYGKATASYGGSLTDGGNGSITAGSYSFDAFATPVAADSGVDLVDFAPVSFSGGVGTTVFTSAPSPKTATFATTAFSTLGIDLDFTLSGGTDLISTSGRLEIAPIPEPGTFALLIAGLVGIAGIARRRLR
jgi:hypothetical protein